MTAQLKIVTDNQAAQMAAGMDADKALEIIMADAAASRCLGTWWDVGEAISSVHQNEYWRNYKPARGKEFHSFDDFCNRCYQKSAKTAYRKMALRRELSTLSREDANRMSQSKAMDLLKLKKRAGESKWCQPKWIDKAVDPHVSDEEFSELVQAALPGVAKDEAFTTLKIPASLMAVYAKTIKVAKKVYELDSDDDQGALEAVLTFFQNTQCETVTYKASNLDVYHGTKRRAKKK